MNNRTYMPLLGVLVLSLLACTETARLPLEAGVGPDPKLPPPAKTLIPTVHIAPATGWPRGAKPIAAEGTAVNTFADGLEHPRWLYVLPNGDVLVAETAAPPRPAEGKGIKGWFMQRALKDAGSAVPSANRITLLRDADGDGVAGARLVELPAGPRNHHWTKNVVASRDGAHLYATVGSNSNVAEHGMQEEEGRAAVWEINRASGSHRIYASGLRNPNGLAWAPRTGALWTAVNERDELGSDLVPDYMTSLRDGAFYGWPYSYYGQNVDERVKPPRPDLVAKATKPDYALGPHTASLGLAYADTTSLPASFQNGMFVGQHGSWNRKPRSGYRVIFVPFSDGRPSGMPIEVLTGFVNDDGEAQGRPVGVALDKRGALLVADAVGNRVWRVTRAGS